MRILVYGAGVIGCELVHELYKGGNDVTLFARGEWKKTIDSKGLVIRHDAQRKTSKDVIKTIDRLCITDQYDIIFVVTQFHQVDKILPIIAVNQSQYIVFIGNNLDPESFENVMKDFSPKRKEIAFGFLSAGGRRENERIVSIHQDDTITLGGYNGKLSDEFELRISQTFAKMEYKLIREDQMRGWLLSHTTFFLPCAYIYHISGGDMKRITKEQVNMIFDAALEAQKVQKKLNIIIRPSGQERYLLDEKRKNHRKVYQDLKSKYGKIMMEEYCRHAFEEMKALDDVFEKMRIKADVEASVWNELRRKAAIR